MTALDKTLEVLAGLVSKFTQDIEKLNQENMILRKQVANLQQANINKDITNKQLQQNINENVHKWNKNIIENKKLKEEIAKLQYIDSNILAQELEIKNNLLNEQQNKYNQLERKYVDLEMEHEELKRHLKEREEKKLKNFDTRVPIPIPNSLIFGKQIKPKIFGMKFKKEKKNIENPFD